jgi:hypothetical protein
VEFGNRDEHLDAVGEIDGDVGKEAEEEEEEAVKAVNKDDKEELLASVHN